MEENKELEIACEGLNDQQKLFAELYITNGNATKSAEIAGYSKNTSSAQGSRMLKNKKVSKYINYLRKQQSKKLGIEAEQVINWVVELANPMNGHSAATQLKANELLMKHLGLLIDKKEITNETNMNIVDVNK